MAAGIETISFPVQGLNRALAYSLAIPSTTPDCMNVRNADVFQERLRGGSRPGLVQILPGKTYEIDDPPEEQEVTYEFFASKDLRIEGNAATDDANWNTGGLSVGNDSAGLLNPLRSMLHFDLSAIPAAATITTASLTMYCSASTSVQAAKIYRMTRTDWVEATCTWNKYDGTLAWTAPGGDFHLTDPTPLAWNLGAVGFQTISGLSVLTQDAYTSRSKQLHIILKADTEAVGNTRNLYRERTYGAGGTTYHPKLSVTYTVVA